MTCAGGAFVPVYVALTTVAGGVLLIAARARRTGAPADGDAGAMERRGAAA